MTNLVDVFELHVSRTAEALSRERARVQLIVDTWKKNFPNTVSSNDKDLGNACLVGKTYFNKDNYIYLKETRADILHLAHDLPYEQRSMSIVQDWRNSFILYIDEEGSLGRMDSSQIIHATIKWLAGQVNPTSVGDIGRQNLTAFVADLQAALDAPKFDWKEEFSPRADLPAATSTPEIKRGSIGHRDLEC